MTTYYRYNALTRVLTAEPNYIVTADGATIVNPTAEQYATLRDAYPKGDDAPQPTPTEGKEVAYAGYELGEDHLWHKQWVLVDAPPPRPSLPPRLAEKRKAMKSRAGRVREVNATFGPGGKVLKVEEQK